MAARLKMFLSRSLRELTGRPIDQLLESRYQKFRVMGEYLEKAEAAVAVTGSTQTSKDA